MTSLRIEPRARADVHSAFSYYEQARLGLGRQFVTRLRQAFEDILEHPLAYPLVEPEVRWIRLQQFPFKVFYLPLENPIRIIAVVHAAAHPNSWKPAADG